MLSIGFDAASVWFGFVLIELSSALGGAPGMDRIIERHSASSRRKMSWISNSSLPKTLGSKAVASSISTTPIPLAARRLDLLTELWQIEGRLVGRWTTDLALIRRDVDENIVDRAFELVVNGTGSRSGNISHYFGGRDQDREQGLISRILGNDSQGTGDLESWAEEYHQNVIDKTKSMKED
jgi:hypothetical protein